MTEPDVRCRPIDFWDGPLTQPHDRRRAPYSAAWPRILKDLRSELVWLDATETVIGIDLRSGDLRLDGWPRGGAKPPPPVSLTTTTKYGPLRYQCDWYDSWHGNVRAIGLTLQRLRLVDEGHCSRSGQQYQGYAALPAGKRSSTTMSAREAAQVIARAANVAPDKAATIMEDKLYARTTIRTAMVNTHSDRGGTDESFREVTHAREALERHHG